MATDSAKQFQTKNESACTWSLRGITEPARRCRRALALLWTLLCLWSLSVCAQANLLAGKPPLPPEQAFKPEITSVSADRITIDFAIEPGYYLYRDKLSFQIDDHQAAGAASASAGDSQPAGVDGLPMNPGLVLGAPAFSEARIMTDEYFGEQAVFRDTARIQLPYRNRGSSETASLAVIFQGCADIGLCYPPTEVSLALQLPPESVSANSLIAAESTTQDVRSEPRTSLSGLLNTPSAQDELLPPERAFVPQLLSATAEQVQVQWTIEEGYYLYRDKLDFSVEPTGQMQILQAAVSRGVMQNDAFFGDVEVLRYAADAQLKLSESALNQSGTLLINYQGCADIGVCFPPSVARLPLVFSSADAAALSVNASPVAPSPAAFNPAVARGNNSNALTVPPQSEQDRLSQLLANSSLWLTVATFFGLGLLLAFTPCVLPMIPILSSLIVGQGDSINTRRAFILSLVYVLTMAGTYALLGIAVGLSGYNIQAALQNPWILSFIAALFVALALSMFGFYELKLPSGLQQKLVGWSNRQSGGQIAGVAAMGFISTLIVGPCVTAPLAGALLYIAKTGDALIGGSALFALGMGMGAPLLLIGTSAGKLIPRAGNWMRTINHLFGILLIAMAIYMLSRVLSAPVTMALFGVLALMSGVFLGATDTLSNDSTGRHRFAKGVGMVVSLYGAALLVGALAGGGSYSRPLEALLAGGGSGAGVVDQHALPFQPIKSTDDLQRVVDTARSQGRPVMLDFYADWCVSCKEMEAFTFTDDRVQALLSNVMLIQADVTANDELDRALLDHFDLFGPPGIIFYNTDGVELPHARVVGFMNADDFSSHIEAALNVVPPVARRQ